MDKYITIEGVKIPYSMCVNTRLKYARIAVDTYGVKVSCPQKVDLSEVEKLLVLKGAWVLEHYKKCLEADDAHKREWKSGEKVLFKGKLYPMVVNDVEEQSIKIQFDGAQFIIYVYKGLKGQVRKDTVKSSLKDLYIKLARAVIDEKLKHFSIILGTAYNDVRIKEQKTRWGSCSGKGNLNFNWKLVMAPEWVMDYVIIHELCHLKHMNHSKEFWNMVSSYIPNYNDARKWLGQNGSRLVL